MQIAMSDDRRRRDPAFQGLRDFGLLLGALTLNRLATAFVATTVVSEVPREAPRYAA